MHYAYFLLSCFFTLILSACSNYMIISETPARDIAAPRDDFRDNRDYAMRIPDHVNTRERVIIVYPSVHTWGAYDEQGNLIRAGIATAGDNWCEDINRPCRTAVGTFRIYSLGDAGCFSSIYPLPNGGGLMPYCMYFHGGQALHGSPDNAVVEDNISHGCVRLRIPDAEWIRYNFARNGTKVIVRPY